MPAGVLLLLGLAVPWLPQRDAVLERTVMAAENAAAPELSETPVPVLLEPEEGAEPPTRGLPEAAAAEEAAQQSDFAYLGSVNSDKYHLPTCSRVSAIREENRVGWVSREEAEAEGREPCKICKPGEAEEYG